MNKFWKKKNFCNIFVSNMEISRKPINFSEDTVVIMDNLAENYGEVFKLLQVIKNSYLDYLVIFSCLEDMNIRGSQINDAFEICGRSLKKFSSYILTREPAFVEAINYCTAMYGETNKAVTAGAIRKLKNNDFNSLKLSKEDINKYDKLDMQIQKELIENSKIEIKFEK